MKSQLLLSVTIVLLVLPWLSSARVVRSVAPSNRTMLVPPGEKEENSVEDNRIHDPKDKIYGDDDHGAYDEYDYDYDYDYDSTDAPDSNKEPNSLTGTDSYRDATVFDKRALGGNSYPSSKNSRLTYANRKKFTKGSQASSINECQDELHISKHSTVHCNEYSGCRVTCDEGYKFPTERTSFMITCVNGVWNATGTDYTSVPDCEPESEPCEDLLPTEHSRVNCPVESFCEKRCHKGFKFPGGEKFLDIICEDGKWTVEGSSLTSVPLCEPEQAPCSDQPEIPPKSTLNCEADRCEARCDSGYKFPSGKASISITCTGGAWTMGADGVDATTGCEQVMPTCNEKTITTLPNATIECDDKSCEATCLKGHKFPSGTVNIKIVCYRNAWVVPGTSWDTIPGCVSEMQTNTKCNGSQYLVFPNLGAYKVNTTHSTWNEAQKTCIHEGAHLAVIDSQEEMNLMKELIAPHHTRNTWTYAHIGFSDLARRGIWVNALGGKLDSTHFAKWAPNSPGRLQERCGAIDHEGRLHDVFCNSPQIFICEKV